MAKLDNHDLNKESLPVQEMFEDLTIILNSGNYEVEDTTASVPAYNAPNETKLVFSLFGATPKLYISYLGDWYYVGLTKV